MDTRPPIYPIFFDFPVDIIQASCMIGTSTREIDMTRYGIRAELRDGTIEETASVLTNKAIAMQVARRLAKQAASFGHDFDTVAYWVEDLDADMGIKKFPVAN